MNQKHEQSIYYANVNANLIKGHVVPINGGITINVDLSVKNDMYVEKIILGIMRKVVVKIENNFKYYR